MKKLGRKKAARKSLLANLATSLILYEQIKVSQAKGKELTSLVQRLIKKASSKTLQARREIGSFLTHQNATKKLFGEIIGWYPDRQSGFVKIFKLKPRLGDHSPQVLIRLIPPTKIEKEKDERKKTTS